MKNSWKKTSCAILSALMVSLSLFSPVEVYAEEEQKEAQNEELYELVDYASNQTVASMSSFQAAYRSYNKKKEEYDNLGIQKDGKVLAVEYGMAYIDQQEGDKALDFLNVQDRFKNTTRGSSGIDAVYLNTDAKQNAHFYISGVEGSVPVSELTIVPLEKIEKRLSAYTVKDGNLYHEIKEEIKDDYYSSIIKVGDQIPYLQEGENYYSYDGHYFYPYDQLRTMLDDYQKGTRENAINKDQPYYDYYQYVGHRTLSRISEHELERYVQKTMGILRTPTYYQDDDRDLTSDILSFSQFSGNIRAFYQYQFEYGANAIMMFAMSENESSDGRSLDAYVNNNLFNHAAFDDEKEAEMKRYRSIDRSIYSHARYYISGSYCSPIKAQYHGGFFGNKANGMNVLYSSDPYWGEKAASFYRRIDEAFDSREKNRYTLGIRTGFHGTPVYQKPSKDSPVLYQTGTMNDMAFLILDKVHTDDGDYYEIQSDATLDEKGLVSLDYRYDFEKDRGYIKTSDIELVIPGNDEEKSSYVHVSFDANGGQFASKETSISYALLKGEKPSITSPSKENALFIGWNEELDSLEEDASYIAQYDEVDHIEMASYPIQKFYQNDPIDITGGSVRVYFKHHRSRVYPMKLEMIQAYDASQIGEQEVQVEFAGCTTSYPVVVVNDEQSYQLRDQLIRIGQAYKDKTELSDTEIEELLTLKQEMDETHIPYFNMPQIREVDHALRLAIGDKIRYRIGHNHFGLEVSGFCLGADLGNSLHKMELLEDTYRVKAVSGIMNKTRARFMPYATYLGEPVGDGLRLNIYKNYHRYSMDGALVVTIDKPRNNMPGDVYTVLGYLSDGNVKKCYTRQSKDTISFMVEQGGQYFLVKRRTSNDYDELNPIESLTENTQSFDMEWILIVISMLGVGTLVFALSFRNLWKSKKEEKVQQQRLEKEEEKKSQPLPPVDVTQALERLNTEMLRLEEIRAAEEKLEKEGKDDK